MASKKQEKRLLEILDQLPDEQVVQLTEYAEFLGARYAKEKEISAPVDIPKPERESVVKAIRRLTATYPMLNRAKILNETSVLMSQHVIQGRDAVEVIEDLEVLFRRHYEQLRGEEGEV